MKDIYTTDKLDVVVDNNVLQDLYELGCVDLLFLVFESVTIPRSIFDSEMLVAIKDSLDGFDYIVGDIHTPEGFAMFQNLSGKPYRKLSRYDKFGIAMAHERSCYCGSNDRLVRRACEVFSILYTGILGVLGRAFYQKRIDRTDFLHYTEKLKSEETTCYIGNDVIDAFLDSFRPLME